MKQRILEELRKIEEREQIHILHAVESGSRGWGFASPDSDYDVRFIYVRKEMDYLRLDPVRDVIELPIDDVLDINGWDLKKALILLHSSNPSLLEWFDSPIEYIHSSFSDEFISIKNDYFVAKSGLYHYLHMAKGNFREYLHRDMVRAKKYFYVLRPILACLWIMDRGTPPPMVFKDLMTAELPENLKGTVENLLELKTNHPEQKLIPIITELNEYMVRMISEIEAKIDLMPQEQKKPFDKLNKLFIKTLKEMGE